MAKTFTSAMSTILGLPDARLSCLMKIAKRSGEFLYLTDHQEAIEYAGDTYVPGIGFDKSAVDMPGNMVVSNLEVTAFLKAPQITDQAMDRGEFDLADFQMIFIDRSDPAGTAVVMKTGWVGQVHRATGGKFKAEIVGLAEGLLEVTIGSFTGGCRADFGSDSTALRPCMVPVAPAQVSRNTDYAVGDYVRVATAPNSPADGSVGEFEDRIYRVKTAGTTSGVTPTFNTTVGEETTDGTVVFVAEEAYIRAGSVTDVTDNRTFSVSVTEARAEGNTTWFAGGLVAFESGLNAGIAREIRNWDGVSGASGITTLFPFPYEISPGDVVRVLPGCDKSIETCQDRYGNAKNFKGFPHLPGQDFATRVATSV